MTYGREESPCAELYVSMLPKRVRLRFAIRFVRMCRCVDYYVGTRKLAVPVAQSYYRHRRRDPEAPLMGLCVLCLRLAMQSV